MDRTVRAARIRSMLFGVAFGDALGSTNEFQSIATSSQHADLIGGGMFGWSPGEWTDDTDQTMIVADAVVAAEALTSLGTKAHIATLAAHGLVAWMHNGPRDIGRTTRSALRARAEGDLPPVEVSESEANGSLMRTAPLAVLPYPARSFVAEQVSKITHPNLSVQRECVDYVQMCADGLNQHPVSGFTATSKTIADCPYLSDGHVMRSTWIAGWAWAQFVLGEASAEDLLVEISAAGGDSDTHCAIAGGVLGAWGAVWPERWYEQIAQLSRIEATAQALAMAYPE